MRIINHMASVKLEREANRPDNSFENFLHALWFVIFLACANMDNRNYVCGFGSHRSELIYEDFNRLAIFYSPDCLDLREVLTFARRPCAPMAVIPDLNSLLTSSRAYYYTPVLYRSPFEPEHYPIKKRPIYPPYDCVTDLKLEDEVEVHTEEIFQLA